METGSAIRLAGGRAVLAALAVGLVHAGFAAVLWDLFGFDDLLELAATKPLLGGYVLLGLFALGFVPTWLALGRGLRSAALVVAGALLVSTAGSWLASPVAAPSAAPTPFGVYVLGWVGVLAVAGLLAGVEQQRRPAASG